MATETVKIADFAPEFGLSGDFKKISEYDFISLNAKLIPVITLLLMEQGSNQLYPDMGARGMLMQMPFSTRGEASAIVSNVQSQLNSYSNCTCTVGLDDSKSNWSTGDVYLSIDVEGVPGTLSLGANKDSVNGMQPFIISHPSIFNK